MSFEKPNIKEEVETKKSRYSDRIYRSVLEVIDEIGILSRVKEQKIGKYHKLPSEVNFVLERLKENNIDPDELQEDDLKLVLKYGLSLIDRKDEYDQELMQKIGPQELVRWRSGQRLENPESFYKIVETLKEHAVAEQPKPIDLQQPRVRFRPKGEYHRKQNLS